MIDLAMLELLANGAFHSGESLGSQLSVSRAAIWKRIHALRMAGIDVQSVPGKGYRLASPIDLLDAKKIYAALSLNAQGALDKIDVQPVVTSTNDLLMQRAREGARPCAVLLAEQQTAGRGRRGRVWASPFAANLYLSLLWEFSGAPTSLDGLSLAVGVALCDAMGDLGISGLQLKWPNDIFLNGHKLGGILIEISGEASGPSAVVIGVGLNVNMRASDVSSIDQPWIDLISAGYLRSRNQLASKIIEHLLLATNEFSLRGFSAYASRWSAYDMMRGKDVVVSMGNRYVTGQALGVNAVGALQVRVAEHVQTFHGGEVSLREQK